MKPKQYVVMTVECPRCKVRQKIQVASRNGFGQKGDEVGIRINCDHHFKVTITDKVVAGPFPA